MRVLALAFIAFITACTAPHSELPYYRSAAMTPEWISDRTANARSMHRVASFHMVDQHGAAITDHALAGKITVVHFFFTACGDICPLTTANLQSLLAQFAGTPFVQILSYSVTPGSDSVAALQAFAARRSISDARWHLLTGTRDDVERVARESFFARPGQGATYGVATVAHTESVYLVDQRGRVRGVYAGMLALEIGRLRQDIATLTRETERPTARRSVSD